MHSRKLLVSAGRILGKNYGQIDCECGRAFSSSALRCKAQILDGRKISQQIISELREEINAWQPNGRKRPHLSVILVGNDAGSQSYVAMKMRAAKKAGISSETMHLQDTVSQPDLLSLIESLNHSRSTDGILVQLPLPSHISERAVSDAVSPEKDVDGFHVNNMGNMCQGKEGLYPCTALGIMELLRRSGIQTFGKNAVVVGRSKNVGMPIAMLMHADGYG
ncbi:hypothetical protein RvY_17749-2 [Ramazzottius varieornatus]|nr:hypothetical protein RvY_17749-2 [Ramazzottius varieornatus]